jgi:DNA-binding LacI/PurR family transcriptional regulator
LVALADLIPYHTLDNAEAYLRVACELAGRLDIDVLVAPVGCMTANLSGNNAKALELLQCLDPARTLVLEREVPGFRCVTKDNEPGMRECMRHLIETCGYTRIAFVSGPETSKGAHEREAIYFEEMEAHGLPTPPSLFARGDFGGDCADVIEKVLDDNHDVEAIA